MAPGNNPIHSDSPTPDQPNQTENSDLRPRSKRRSRRPAAELGLGADQDLADLAKAFIELRREHFPDLTKRKLDEDPSPAVIEKMVADFKERHGTGVVSDIDRNLADSELSTAACYLRFSDDNSQVRSIIDQLRKVMQRAGADGVVPLWSLLFADYGRSAVFDTRLGFEGLIKRMQAGVGSCKCVLIDEFARGSRGERDAWRLAGMCKRLNINLVGASDGFTLANEDWDFKVGIYNTFNRMESKYKAMRVRRGMEGAAADKQVLGRPPFGYTRAVKRDVNGNVVTGNKGEPVHVWALDPEASVWAYEIFRLAIVEKWLPYKIAQHLNTQKIDGWDGWEPSGVINILVNPVYIGLFIWGRTTKEYNHETGKHGVIKRPWKQWTVTYDKSLAMIPKSWHVQLRKKYEKDRPGRPAPKRLPDRVAVTLFSKALKCGYCGGDIKLTRSNTKSDYRALYCPNGGKCARGCKLKASKSVRIIEKCLLNYIHTYLLTEEAMLELVERANTYLVAEAAKPKASAAAEKAQLRQFERQRDTLMGRLKGKVDPDLIAAYESEVAKLQRHIADLRKLVNEKEAANAPVPPPLDLSQVQTYLADLRGLLSQEVPAAAEAIAELTGPIKITQEAIPGMKTKAKWIATFSPDFLGLLSQLGAAHNYPDCVSLEFLSRAKWIIPSEVTVEIREVPAYERMGQKYKVLRDNGASIVVIAAAHGTSQVSVSQAIGFAETGERPVFKAGRRTGEHVGKTPKYMLVADDVDRLRKEGKSYRQAIDWLKEHRAISVSTGVISRAIDFKNPDEVRGAMETGEPPVSRQVKSWKLPEAIRRRIRLMLEQGVSAAEIAGTVRCCVSTVHSIRKEMK